MNDNIPKNEEEFKRKLTREQYEVLRQKGTEPAFSGKLIRPDKDGFYKCAALKQKQNLILVRAGQALMRHFLER